MKNARILSYGMIPIYDSSEGRQVLLIEQYGAQGTHWGFPKGKGEPGEPPLEAALRETKEEAGITFKEVLDEAYFTVNYSFTYEDTIVAKTVTYFIGFVNQPGLALQTAEVKQAGWYSLEEARLKLSFMNDKEMFDTAIVYLHDHPTHGHQ